MAQFDEAYFQNNVQRFYADVDQAFRTHGCEKLGSHDIYFRLSRMAAPMIEYSEIKRICSDVDRLPLEVDEPGGHRRWTYAWGRAAERYKNIAENAELAGYRRTAGLNFIRASLLAHAGQLFSRPEWPEKNILHLERINCYRQGAAYLGIEEIHIPYETIILPGYLWMPTGINKPAVVIMVPGANSTKEELHRWADAFVQRGLAAFYFDGPGQGEKSPLLGCKLPMRLELYHHVLTTVIDHLKNEHGQKLNMERLALWGQATGGHLITRAYEHERRPVALVNLDGTPSLKGYPYLPGDLQEEQRAVYGCQSYEETWAYLEVRGDAMPSAQHIDVPYLIIHGMRNVLAGKDAMQQLAHAVGDNAELMTFEDGNLGVFNWDTIMTDAMADWLMDKLR